MSAVPDENEPLARLLIGDARTVLATLPAESVHCVVTSPPYYGLRDYRCAGQIGLEATPGEYLEELLGVFSEVHRVLRCDGTLWLNIGDSYATDPKGAGGRASSTLSQSGAERQRKTTPPGHHPWNYRDAGYKRKDLLGIPWMLSFALRDAGWWLRAEIIWHKPNVMPESVRDRPTRSHETIFLLARSERYFYDDIAVRENVTSPPHSHGANGRESVDRVPAERKGKGNAISFRGGGIYTGGRSFENSATVERETHGNVPNETGTRNLRDVWTIATEAIRDMHHFATFPQALVEPCLLAGTSARGACSSCGAPWRRVVDRLRTLDGQRDEDLPAMRTTDKHAPSSAQGVGHYRIGSVREERGWEPTCRCSPVPPPAPCTVLDPFVGSGTTMRVATRLGRRSIGIDLNPEYEAMVNDRTSGVQMQMSGW